MFSSGVCFEGRRLDLVSVYPIADDYEEKDVAKAVAALEGTWMLVTDASTLKAGDEIIIAAKDYDVALSTTQANNNRPEVEITKNGNTITATSEAQVLTLQAGNIENTLALYTGAGYLYAASSGSNYLRTETTLSDNSSWTISIANDGTATLTAQGTNTRNTMFYNNSNKIFSCYAAGTTTQKAIALYKKVDESEVLAPGFTPAGGTFYGAQSVEITCATDGAEIYYTLDGSVPTSGSTKYTTAISIAETKTLKAIAIKGENSSSVTEATYTILAPLSTMDEIYAKATEVGSTATSVKVAMNNWVVTGVKNSNAYVTDGTKGLIIYNASHGFNVGDVLSGTVTCKVQLYNGSSELTELTSSTTGLTVTTGGTVTPVVVDDVNTLSGVNTGAVVKITGTCTQESSKYYVAGVQLYNSLFTFTNPTVGNKYNVTGVYLQYNSTKEILPRQQEDIEEIVDALPSATISIANITMEIGETKTIEATITPEDAPITYETTATCITLNGTTITAVSEGTATITATIAGKAGEYTGVTKTFTVTVNAPNIATLPFAFNSGKADIEDTPGMSQNGLGSDYGSAPLLKFDGTGDYVIIHFNGEPGKLSYDIKGNSYSDGTFTVQESADGSAYTNIVEYTELGSTETKTHTLAATSRYVKFIYTEKENGNVALGNIKIALPEEEPGEGGGETPEERLTDWVLTPLADITTNDLVVITMTKGETTWAMTNDNGTSAPTASVVILSADALAAEPDANLKWVVSNDNGTLTIYPYGGYETWLYCTNANNGVRVGTGEAKEFTINANYLYTSQTTDPRHIGVYNEQDWRCYKPSSGAIATNIADQTLAFYVKKNANDVLPGTGEDPEGGEGGEDPVVPTPTINATATFIFNTAEGLNDLGITYPATPTTVEDGTEDAFKTEFENNATFTQDGITMTTTGGTVVATRVWLTAAGKLDLRVYKGATLTFSVPAEHKISAIVFDGSNIGHLLVNGTAVSGNAWTGSEKTVTFTAKDDAKTIKINTIAFVVEYTRDVTNTYGTICLPYGSTNYAGATFYQVVGKEEGKVYLESVTVLEAGVPYIFEKSASQIKVAYEGEAVAAPQNGDANGLVGTFEEIEVPNGMYILYNNAFCTNEPAGTLNKIRANRAYLNMNDVPGEFTKMPGRRYIGMAVEGENAETGLENIIVPEGQAVKVISNGQLIIIRDGEMYNAQGQKL